MADGLEVTEREGVRIATVIARRGIVAGAIGDALGFAVASTPEYAGSDLALIGSGPGVWLAIGTFGGEEWHDSLERRLAGLAYLIDQTGGYVLFRFFGESAKTLLQRGVFIDLHPEVFKPGASLATFVAHIPVLLWRTHEETPVFEVAVATSYAECFRDWITIASATL